MRFLATIRFGPLKQENRSDGSALPEKEDEIVQSQRVIRTQMAGPRVTSENKAVPAEEQLAHR